MRLRVKNLGNEYVGAGGVIVIIRGRRFGIFFRSEKFGIRIFGRQDLETDFVGA